MEVTAAAAAAAALGVDPASAPPLVKRPRLEALADSCHAIAGSYPPPPLPPAGSGHGTRASGGCGGVGQSPPSPSFPVPPSATAAAPISVASFPASPTQPAPAVRLKSQAIAPQRATPAATGGFASQPASSAPRTQATPLSATITTPKRAPPPLLDAPASTAATAASASQALTSSVASTSQPRQKSTSPLMKSPLAARASPGTTALLSGASAAGRPGGAAVGTKSVVKAAVAAAPVAPPPPARSPSQGFATMLYNAFAKNMPPASATTPDADEAHRHAKAVAAAIAACLPHDFESAKDTAVMLKINLEDAKNAQLRQDVLGGVLSPEVLVEMPEHELVNPDIRADREKGFQDRNRHKDWSELTKSKSVKSTLYKCRRCDSRNVSWELRQTRSGDEPMTVCCFCNACQTSFRIYS